MITHVSPSKQRCVIAIIYTSDFISLKIFMEKILIFAMKIYTPQSLYPTKFIPHKIYTPQNLYPHKIYTPQNLYHKIYTLTKFIPHKIYIPQNLCLTKFMPNKIPHSGNIWWWFIFGELAILFSWRQILTPPARQDGEKLDSIQ